MAVALVVPAVRSPEDVAVADEDELDMEEECVDETEEVDEFDDELEDEMTDPGLPGAPACLITFNTPCRQRIEANCPEENPEIETRGSSRHTSCPIEIRDGPSAEIFPVANCAVGPARLAPATPVEASMAAIATTSPPRIATKSAYLRALCQRGLTARAAGASESFSY